jgi:hypothetical protein
MTKTGMSACFHCFARLTSPTLRARFVDLFRRLMLDEEVICANFFRSNGGIHLVEGFSAERLLTAYIFQILLDPAASDGLSRDEAPVARRNVIPRELHRFFSRPRQNFEPAFDQELLWIAARALNPAILFPAAHISTGRTHILRGDGKVFG